MNFLQAFSGRVAYRVRQFFSVLFPRIDQELWREARDRLPPTWRKPFDRLRPSETAHVIRLYKTIKNDTNLGEADREELILLALTHDLGKGVTRPTLFEKVVKALLPIPNRAHPILGARILQRLGATATLIRRVRNHHRPAQKDRLLRIFQTYDNSL